jgi:hypothetical protein
VLIPATVVQRNKILCLHNKSTGITTCQVHAYRIARPVVRTTYTQPRFAFSSQLPQHLADGKCRNTLAGPSPRSQQEAGAKADQKRAGQLSLSKGSIDNRFPRMHTQRARSGRATMLYLAAPRVVLRATVHTCPMSTCMSAANGNVACWRPCAT